MNKREKNGMKLTKRFELFAKHGHISFSCLFCLLNYIMIRAIYQQGMFFAVTMRKVYPRHSLMFLLPEKSAYCNKVKKFSCHTLFIIRVEILSSASLTGHVI